MKKTLLFLFLGVAAHVACAQSIMIVGDSLSAAYNIPAESGWVNLFQQKLVAERPGEHRVINASISGDTTAGGLARLPKLLSEFTPDIVVLALGGNDGLRGLPLRLMQQNLQRMIDLSRKQDAEVVVISVQLPRSYGRVFNQKFQQIYLSLAERNGVPLIPFGFELLNDPTLLQEDGIHPTAEAQPLIAEHVWSQLENHLAE